MKLKHLLISFALLCVVATALVGCNAPAQETTPTTNTNYQVDLLFEKDGIKVYRFQDGGYKYYIDARGAASWDEARSVGKTVTTTNHAIPTAR